MSRTFLGVLADGDGTWTVVPQQAAPATPSIPGLVTPLGYWWSKLQPSPAASTYAPAAPAAVLTTPVLLLALLLQIVRGMPLCCHNCVRVRARAQVLVSAAAGSCQY